MFSRLALVLYGALSPLPRVHGWAVLLAMLAVLVGLEIGAQELGAPPLAAILGVLFTLMTLHAYRLQRDLDGRAPLTFSLSDSDGTVALRTHGIMEGSGAKMLRLEVSVTPQFENTDRDARILRSVVPSFLVRLRFGRSKELTFMRPVGWPTAYRDGTNKEGIATRVSVGMDAGLPIPYGIHHETSFSFAYGFEESLRPQLSRSFVRLTMNALGQRPQHLDCDVDWVKADGWAMMVARPQTAKH
jgi:hypothetical protein